MTAVRPPYGSDLRRVARHREPVVHRGPDPAAPDRRLAGAFVAGDQQKQPVAGGDRSFEPAVDRIPCLIEVQPVKVENAVWLDISRPKPPVPAGIERCRRMGSRPLRRLGRRRFGWRGERFRFRRRLLCGSIDGIARKWPDRRRYPRPKSLFLRAERAHGRLRLGEGEQGPAPWPPFRRRSAAPGHLPPRRCRPGSLP